MKHSMSITIDQGLQMQIPSESKHRVRQVQDKVE